MGYRDNWLNHPGSISTHNECVLHAVEREIPLRPSRALIIGVDNGGALEVWQRTLPAGSEVIGMDKDPRCTQLPGLNVIECDVTQKDNVRAALRGQWFNIIIDTTCTMAPYTWPFLSIGGIFMYENYNLDMMLMLTRDIALDDDSWLPIEEVMRVDIYPTVAVIEKRSPRVTPYMDLMTGNFSDITPESELIVQGVKRVIV